MLYKNIFILKRWKSYKLIDKNNLVLALNPVIKNEINLSLDSINFKNKKLDNILENIFEINNKNSEVLENLWNNKNIIYNELLNKIVNLRANKENFEQLNILFEDIYLEDNDRKKFTNYLKISMDLNIIKFSLWKKFCNEIFLNANNFNLVDLDISLDILIKYINKFFKINGLKNNIFWFELEEIKEILSFFHLNSFMVNISEIMKNSNDEDYIIISEIIIKFLKLIKIYLKLGNINSIEKFNMFIIYHDIIGKNISLYDISNKNLQIYFELFSKMIINGFDYPDFINKFSNISLIYKPNNDIEIINYINIITVVWKTINNFDKELYDIKIRNYILNYFRLNGKSSYAINIISNLSNLKLEDNLIFEHLFHNILNLRWNKISYFQKAILHTSIENLIFKNLIDLSIFKKLELENLRSSLNLFCLSYKYKNFKFNNLLWVTDKQSHNNIKTCNLTKNINNLELNEKNIVYHNVGIEKNFKISLKKYLPLIFKNYNIKIIEEELFCQYRWDISIYFTELNYRVGIELSSLVYKLYSGNYYGNKLKKFNISEKFDFDYIIIEIEKDEYLRSLLQNYNKDNGLIIAVEIANKLKEFIINKYNKNLLLSVE